MTNRVATMPCLRRSLRALLVCAMGLGAALTAIGARADERPVGLEAQRALTVTIYNQDLAQVSEQRLIDVQAGENRIALLDVSARLRPETVILQGAGLTLVEQGFEADLLSLPRLLEKALGQRVWVRRGGPGEEYYVEAELVSTVSGPLVRIDGRLESVTPDRLAFAGGEKGLRDRPTLVATLLSEAAGERALGLSYLTGGLTWRADYVAALNAAEDRLALTGLVTLVNDSGSAFQNARLRLVAGEVNQAAPAPVLARAQFEMSAATAPTAAPKLAEQPVGEQHLYTLDRPVSLDRHETKQVTLLPGRSLPVTKEYRFEELVNAYGGAEEIGPLKAAVVLEFTNRAERGPGKPLPAGVVRVYQEAPDAAEAPLFIGEDRIDHSAEGEKVRLTIGRAFDVTGEARQTVFERISDKSYDSGQEITVRNAKDSAVTVTLVGVLPRGWRMLEESLPHQAESANRLAWRLPVPAKGSATFSYKVRVTNP